MLKILSSSIALIVSGILLVALLRRWLPRDRKHAASDDLGPAIREDRWSHVCASLLKQACDAILGSGSRLRSFRRSVLFGTLLLIFVLSLAGLVTGHVMGLSDWPWNLFDREMAIFEKATTTPGSSHYLHDLAIQARTGAWKFAYVAAALPLIAGISGSIFWAALLTTRFFVFELESADSWAQKAGLMLGLCVVVLLLANAATFLVSALISLNPLLMLVLAKVGFSGVLLAAGGVAINAFTLYLSDPWLRGLLVAALFPCLSQLALTAPALAVDLTRSVVRKSQLAVVTSAREKLRGAFIPALMIVAAGYFVYWFLRRIL